MTYSASACQRLEYWHDRYDGRVLLVAPAHLAHYRPRRGLADDLSALAGVRDCQIAAYVPSSWWPAFAWTDENLDMRSSISKIVETCLGVGKIITLGAYTGELELDLCGVLPSTMSDL